MRRHLLAWGLATAVAIVATACNGQGGSETKPGPPEGGTLRVGAIDFHGPPDPQYDISGAGIELGRCCLVRTLFSYNGLDVGQNGALPQPDLATGPPTVSEDGLTWTFRIRQGIRYSPPLQNTEVVARDFIRSMQREIKLERDYGGGIEIFYIEAIVGARDFADGKAETISGVEAPDDHTLVVRVIQPTGDLPYRLSFPATAPLPANPAKPTARFGIAEGHDGDFGGFLVATGPYMLRGSERMDFSVAPKRQRAASGAGESSLSLVRNPSWRSETDPLRRAFAANIRVEPAGKTPQEAARRVEDGDLDAVLDLSLPNDLIERYSKDPALRGQIHSTPRSFHTASLNVAAAPFDDLHVRRAIEFAVNRQATVDLWRRQGQDVAVATHLALNSTENNLLSGYAPYGAGPGNLKQARKEMAASAYDRNHDGTCDDPACSTVHAVVRDDPPYFRELASSIRSDLRPIGVDLRFEVVSPDEAFRDALDPPRMIGMSVGDGWSVFYPSGSNLFPTFLGSQGIGPDQCCNLTLVGATTSQLKRWGYQTRNVPSVDDRIERCLGLVLGTQVACWAEFDQYSMEEVAAWIPLFYDVSSTIVSRRLGRFSFDQLTGAPALDQLPIRTR